VDHTLIALAGTTVDTTAVNVTMIKAAALLGSGIAVLGVIGPGVGIGLAGSRALEGMARQPEMSTKLLTNALIIAALMEALGLMAFIMAVMLWQYAKTL
jgi:F-type H+-transporting ATPase subunit c